MKTKDWRTITAATVQWATGRVETYQNIDDALLAIGWSTITGLKCGHLSGIVDGMVWRKGDSVIVIDECGIIIPPWRLLELANRIPDSQWPLWRFHRWSPIGYSYRQGPVFGIRKRSWRGYHRKLATTQERRENEFLDYDEDALEVGVKARPQRCGHNLPTSWDDLPESRHGNGWKNYRKTQWKE